MAQRKFSILIIDDSEVILARAAMVLQKAGFDVFTTTQTYAAKRFLENVDLVIVDYYMPGMSGGELVKQLREACAELSPGAVFYLNTSDEAIAREYKKYGFDGAFAGKGDDEALVQSVSNVAKMQSLQSLRSMRMRGAGEKKP